VPPGPGVIGGKIFVCGGEELKIQERMDSMDDLGLLRPFPSISAGKMEVPH